MIEIEKKLLNPIVNYDDVSFIISQDYERMGVFGQLKEMKLRFITSKDTDSMHDDAVKNVKQ